jgi:hypothetical protein
MARPNDPEATVPALVKGEGLFVRKDGRLHAVRRPQSRRGARRHQSRGERVLGELLKPVYSGTYSTGGTSGLDGFNDDGEPRRAASPIVGFKRVLAPLAQVVSKTVDYDKLLRLGRGVSFPHLALLTVMVQSLLSEQFWRAQAGGEVPLVASAVPLSPLLPSHLADLRSWGVVSPKQRRCGVGLALRHFLVWKADALTTRMVSCAQHVSRPDWWQFPEGLELFDITTAAALVHKGAFALTCDMRSFFFQFCVCPIVFLRIAQAREIFVVNRLLQGWCGAPFFAQLVLALLVWGFMAASTQVLWLDNWVAFGEEDALNGALQGFEARCALVGATIKETAIARVVDVIGVRWDMTEKSVTTLPAFSAKLGKVLGKVGREMTLRQFLSVIMACMWHVRVHHGPPGRHLKEGLRVLAHAMGGGVLMDQVMILPFSALSELQAYLQVVLAAVPWGVPPRPSATQWWYADASPFGWGVVRGDFPIDTAEVPPQAQVWQGQWLASEAAMPQFRREAMALGQMGRIMGEQGALKADKHYKIYMDPLGMIGAMKKGFSPSLFVNGFIVAFREQMRSVSWEFIFVMGPQNPADGPSRRFPFH